MNQSNGQIFNIKRFMQSMTNRLLLITIIAYFVIEALFANAWSGLELYHWESSAFRPWQVFTYLFLHSGYFHLGANMFALWSFGRVLESVWGKQRFLIFYIACGVGAAIVQQLIDTLVFSNSNNDVMVGASGAIYGILIAFALIFPNFKIFLLFIPVPVAAKYFVPVLLLIDLSAGITGISIFGLNVAHFAHLGGALTGLLLVMLWLNNKK